MGVRNRPTPLEREGRESVFLARLRSLALLRTWLYAKERYESSPTPERKSAVTIAERFLRNAATTMRELEDKYRLAAEGAESRAKFRAFIATAELADAVADDAEKRSA